MLRHFNLWTRLGLQYRLSATISLLVASPLAPADFATCSCTLREGVLCAPVSAASTLQSGSVPPRSHRYQNQAVAVWLLPVAVPSLRCSWRVYSSERGLTTSASALSHLHFHR